MNQYKESHIDLLFIVIIVCFLLFLLSIPTCAHASFIPDTPQKVNQLADAIFWAEGGYKTNFPYGIKSVKCEGYDECRRICKNTIRNNDVRFKAQMLKGKRSTYLQFLQSRYCPTTGNLSQSEKALNQHWLKNVKWFLNNPKGEKE